MSKNESRVILLDKQIEEFSEVSSGAITEIFPGFSERLNFLIDLTDLGIPDLDNGRQAHISSLMQASRMAPGDWLKKDKPPKASTLRNLVGYLLRHIKGENNVFKVEAWLKYGNEIVPNPFVHASFANQALLPLATTLIVTVATEHNMPTNKFDLDRVVTATLEMLSNFELTHESKVTSAHRKIIAQLIHSHVK